MSHLTRKFCSFCLLFLILIPSRADAKIKIMTTSEKYKYSSHVVIAKVLSVEETKKAISPGDPTDSKYKKNKAVVLCQSIFKGVVTTKTKLTLFFYTNANNEAIRLKKGQKYLFFVVKGKASGICRVVNSSFGAIPIVSDKNSKPYKKYLKVREEVQSLAKKQKK